MEDWARLQPRDVSLQWHEAVAIVRDVAEAIAGGQIREVPASTALAVDASGTVHLLQPAGASSRSTDQAEIVAGLRRLLGELLPSSGTPQELRLVADNPATSIASVEEFQRALAFFERPSRQRDLAALAARLREFQEQYRLEAELESLTRKTRTEAPQPASSEAAAPNRAKPRLRVRAAVLFGAVAALAVLASAGLLIARTTPSASAGTPGSVAATATTQARSLLNKVRETATSVFGTSSSPAAPEPTETATATAGKRNRPARSPAARKRPSPLRAESAAAIPPVMIRVPTQSTQAPALPVPQPYVAAWDAAIGEPITEEVYDRANDDVIPAMLLRPHLPTVTPTDAVRRGLSVLEAVISADGQVEQVRLVRTTPERRYYDIMLLAAVKAWVFQPASRQGQPVRYRVRIPLT